MTQRTFRRLLIHCPECGVGFNDAERISMVRYAEADGGGWEPSKPTRGHASFQLICPVFPAPPAPRHCRDISGCWRRNESSSHVLDNTCLGDYLTKGTSEGAAEEHDLLAERVEEYPAEVPARRKNPYRRRQTCATGTV